MTTILICAQLPWTVTLFATMGAPSGLLLVRTWTMPTLLVGHHVRLGIGLGWRYVLHCTRL